MEELIVFNITEEENNLIHYYFLLTETYKNVLVDIISNRRCLNANKELLNYYNDLYIKYDMEFNLIKNQIVDLYYTDKESNSNITFRFDFRKCQLIILNNEKR